MEAPKFDPTFKLGRDRQGQAFSHGLNGLPRTRISKNFLGRPMLREKAIPVRVLGVELLVKGSSLFFHSVNKRNVRIRQHGKG